jgi:hypothetical protein
LFDAINEVAKLALLGHSDFWVQAEPYLDVGQPLKHSGRSFIGAWARCHNKGELIASIHLLRESETIRI